MLADRHRELFLHFSFTKASSGSAGGPAFLKIMVDTNCFNLVYRLSSRESPKQSMNTEILTKWAFGTITITTKWPRLSLWEFSLLMLLAHESRGIRACT